MRAYSAFFDLIEEVYTKPIKEARFAYITTASKGVEDISYTKRHAQTFKERGWDFEEIDIEEGDNAFLKKRLLHKDIIHVGGGNTFYLLKAMRESGFDKVVKDVLEIEVPIKSITYTLSLFSKTAKFGSTPS